MDDSSSSDSSDHDDDGNDSDYDGGEQHSNGDDDEYEYSITDSEYESDDSDNHSGESGDEHDAGEDSDEEEGSRKKPIEISDDEEEELQYEFRNAADDDDEEEELDYQFKSAVATTTTTPKPESTKKRVRRETDDDTLLKDEVLILYNKVADKAGLLKIKRQMYEDEQLKKMTKNAIIDRATDVNVFTFAMTNGWRKDLKLQKNTVITGDLRQTLRENLARLDYKGLVAGYLVEDASDREQAKALRKKLSEELNNTKEVSKRWNTIKDGLVHYTYIGSKTQEVGKIVKWTKQLVEIKPCKFEDSEVVEVEGAEPFKVNREDWAIITPCQDC